MKLNRIKPVLKERGISQTWLAKRLGNYIATRDAEINANQNFNHTTTTGAKAKATGLQ